MRFARIVYLIAAFYGFISLIPLYFMLNRVGQEAPPAVTHPEFYYGFLGVTLLWQMVFLMMAKDPIRYRPLMPISILEKLVYAVPVLLLYSLGRVHPSIMRSSLPDLIFGLLFAIAYLRTTGYKSNT
ncbi:MAG TPA: hypothetical protein VH437_13720 [Terriglobales bacterium]|jgi:hypothetical protein